MAEGWEGWDEYAPFYDWENAQTVARRDVPFWQRLAAAQEGLVLELGCGTGRITVPVVRAGANIVGIDRSAPMLTRARQRLRRARASAMLLRGDIRHLPFRRRAKFDLVMAPYGILQSLTRERDLRATLESVAGVVRKGGLFAIDLVPDLPRWSEYDRRVSLAGRRGRGHLTLTESVRQDRRRGLTIFDQEYRGTARPGAHGPTLLPDLPHHHRSADAEPARGRGLPRRRGARRLRWRSVGSPRRRLGDAGSAAVATVQGGTS